MQLAAADPSSAIKKKRAVPSSPFALFAEGGPSDIFCHKEKKGREKNQKEGKSEEKKDLVNFTTD